MDGKEHKAMPLIHLTSPMPQASLNGGVYNTLQQCLSPEQAITLVFNQSIESEKTKHLTSARERARQHEMEELLSESEACRQQTVVRLQSWLSPPGHGFLLFKE